MDTVTDADCKTCEVRMRQGHVMKKGVVSPGKETRCAKVLKLQKVRIKSLKSSLMIRLYERGK